MEMFRCVNIKNFIIIRLAWSEDMAPFRNPCPDYLYPVCAFIVCFKVMLGKYFSGYHRTADHFVTVQFYFDLSKYWLNNYGENFLLDCCSL